MANLTKYIMALSLLIYSCAAFSNDTQFMKLYKKNKSKTNTISLLFLQHAGMASIKPISNNCYNVTLTKLQPKLLYFSDRPYRIAGELSTQKFVNLWQQDKTKPNVVLHAHIAPNRNSKTLDTILTLSDPSYDQTNRTMQAKACLIKNNGNNTAPAKTLYDVTIFYDDICLWCHQ